MSTMDMATGRGSWAWAIGAVASVLVALGLAGCAVEAEEHQDFVDRGDPVMVVDQSVDLTEMAGVETSLEDEGPGPKDGKSQQSTEGGSSTDEEEEPDPDPWLLPNPHGGGDGDGDSTGDGSGMDDPR